MMEANFHLVVASDREGAEENREEGMEENKTGTMVFSKWSFF